MTVTLNDFNKCCRCCLVTIGPFKPLFGASLDEMLFQLVSVKLEKNDGYPQQVCMRCILKLSAAFNFQQTVLTSRQVLIDIVEASKTGKKEKEFVAEKLIEDYESFEEYQSESILKQNDLFDRVMDDKEDVKSVDNLVTEVREDSQDEKNSSSMLLVDTGTSPILDGSVVNDVTSSQEFNDSSSSQAYEMKDFQCTHCEKQFNSRVNLKVHMLNHQEVCEGASRACRTRHARRPRSHACHACGRTFSDLSNLSKHVRSHTGEMRNTAALNLCCYCGKRFKWRTSLYKHLRHHNGQMYECGVCGKKFADSSYMRIHVMSHSGTDPKPFMCEQCGVPFTQKSSLTKHRVMVHVTQRPRHQCPECSKSFLHKFSLRTHQIRSHSCVQRQLHKCGECGREFKLAKSLSSHLGHHKKMAEKLAENKKKEMEKMELGQRIDEAAIEEPTRMRTFSVQYLCLNCRREFSSRDTLQNHKCPEAIQETVAMVPVEFRDGVEFINSDEGVDPTDDLMNCRLCELSFISSRDFLAHHQTVHEDLEVMDGDSVGTGYNDIDGTSHIRL